MKILERPQIFVPFEENCANCGTRVLVEEPDVQCHYYAGDQRERSSEYFFFVCPICHKQNAVEPGKLSRFLKNTLLQAKRGW